MISLAIFIIKTIREWERLGKIKSKFKDIAQKLNFSGKWKHLFNHKTVLLLFIVFTTALIVVFSQYPQILTSLAKSPQQQCGISNARCCSGNQCNSGLECYAPDASTPKRCKSNAAVCGNSVDRPCCLPDGSNEQTQEFCYTNLSCDTSKQPRYPYQNPWNSGMCKVSYGTCGGVNESGKSEPCCGNPGDVERCDTPLKCVVNVGQGVVGFQEVCGYPKLVIQQQDTVSQLQVNANIPFYIVNNLIVTIDDFIKMHFYEVDCGNGITKNYLTSDYIYKADDGCRYSLSGKYYVSVKGVTTLDDTGTRYTQYDNVSLDISDTTPTPKPTKTPTPKPTSTPTPQYTCNGFCLPNGEDCYNTGTGTCQSGRFCCKTVDAPTATPTTRPPTSTPVPTKAPNGTACSTASQCTSGICKTCSGETQGYCRPNGYTCPF